MKSSSQAPILPSCASGPPLAEEAELGALTLPAFIREVTERFSTQEALVMYGATGVERWRYDDVWRNAMAVARALHACGVGKGCRVGILMTNRLEWVASAFGIALAGGVVTGLSTFSTAAELQYLLQASGVSVLLFERRVLKKDFGDMVRALVPEATTMTPGALYSEAYPFLRHLVQVGDGDATGAIEDWSGFLARGKGVTDDIIMATAATVMPADPAVLLFSSGSTSRPKGIISAQRGVCVQLWRWARIYDMKIGVRTWTSNGFFWSGNFVMALGATLARGGAIVLQSAFDPAEALELMAAEKVSCPLAWPHQWAQLAAADNWHAVDIGSIRHAESGSPFHLHPSVATEWVEPMGAYGCTETFTIVMSFPACVPRPDQGGEILPGNTIKIVDPLSGEIVPRGQLGEIAVKGPTLMMGYLGIPLDETLDEDGFLHTGDSGFMNEQGIVFFKGRLSDIIKTGGANVSPLEIDAILSTCPGIKAVKTVGLPHETLGEIVVSCVVLHQGYERRPEDIQAYARTQLASYKVPRQILFFDETEIVLTGTNKIKTAEMRELAMARTGNGIV